jgi:hypothetical protein
MPSNSLHARYLRALAALYIRMTFRAVDVFEILEPLLKDYRKLRLRDMCRCNSRHSLMIISTTHHTKLGFRSLTWMSLLTPC